MTIQIAPPKYQKIGGRLATRPVARGPFSRPFRIPGRLFQQESMAIQQRDLEDRFVVHPSIVALVESLAKRLYKSETAR